MKENVVVTVKQGKLRGRRCNNVEGGNYLAFLGIPYAKPPIGSLRFKDTEPPEPWTGIKDALEFGNPCCQSNFLPNQRAGSEDCLYLNVYTNTIEIEKKQPVIVWIHGGSFLIGSGDDDLFGPDYLLKKDVVLVTLNYRLGIFGFLNLENELATGNQGLKDQIMALRWVQDNISNFGGDPDNVTLFGESAGSVCVNCLAVSPLAKGLFHKVIMHSGTMLNPWGLCSDTPRVYGFRIARVLGHESTDPKEVFEFLQSVDSDKLLAAQKSTFGDEQSIQKIPWFAPTADMKSKTPVLPFPNLLAKQGINVPLLLGYNQCEGQFFARKSIFVKILPKLNADLEWSLHPRIVAILRKDGISGDQLKRHYFSKNVITEEDIDNYAVMLGDMHIEKGMHDLVNIQTKSGHDQTYFFKFSFDGEMSVVKLVYDINKPGAGHGDELSYIFRHRVLELLNQNKIIPGSKQYRVMQYFTEMWSNFAKTGNPTPRKTELIPIQWEPIRNNDMYNYLRIDETLKMETARKGEQRFDWKKLKNKL